MVPQSDGSAPHAPPRREIQRLFFALWPDTTVRRAVAAATRRLQAEHRIGGRPLQPARYHLTLQFLGDFDPLPPSQVAAALAAGDAVCAPRFQLLLDRAAGFVGPRVGWLGPHRSPPALEELRDALRLQLEGLDVPRPRIEGAMWTPHVTILRGVSRPLPEMEIPRMPWAVEEFVLIRSQPQRDYSILRSWKLAG